MVLRELVQEMHELRGMAHTHDHNARRERVERAGVADRRHAEGPRHLVDAAARRGPDRLDRKSVV